MYQIGNKVCKVYENGEAVTDENNIEMLREMDELSIINLADNDKVLYNPFNYSLKRANIDCTHYYSKDEVDGKNKLEFIFELNWVHDYFPGNITNTRVNTKFYLRSKKKTLGVWYWASRTISHGADVEYSCSQNTLTQNWVNTKHGYGGWYLSHDLIPLTAGVKATQLCFGEVDTYASTPDVDPIEIFCNGNPYFSK